MLSPHFFKEWGFGFGAGMWIQNLTHTKQVLYHWAVTYTWRYLQNVSKLYSIPIGDRRMSPLPSLLCMWCVYACTHARSCVLKVDIKRFSSPLYLILLDSVSLDLKPAVIPDELVSTLPELGFQVYPAIPGFCWSWESEPKSLCLPSKTLHTEPSPSPWPLLFLN